MSIIQILRMIWARKFIVLIVFLATTFGAFVVTQVAAPRYVARARINMNVLQGDPVTGQMVNLKSMGPYVTTQIEMLKDYSVAGKVVDQLGWLSDPGFIRQYAARPKTETRDFRRWLAQRVADRTNGGLSGGGAVLEIGFNSGDPIEARVGAEALRKAFMETSLETRRKDAAQLAGWYDEQAGKARKAAEEAELTKAAAERQYGIVMQNQMDLDSARLSSLAGAVPIAPVTAPGTSAGSIELANLDAQIVEASKTLGPNHPAMLAMQAKRTMLARVVSQESSRIAAMSAASAGAVTSALAAEKSKVISQRDKVERLRQLQSDVDLRREQYRKTAARAAQLNLEAAVADTGMKELGVVVTPTQPAFPNKPLIMGGAAGLGLAMGLFLVLFIELLFRRVRGVDDLVNGLDVPCIGVIGVAQERRFRLSLPAPKRARTRPAVAA